MKPTSTASRARISIFVLLGLLVIAFVGIRTISDPDIWTHLNTGRLITESGVPHEDVFSFTKAGEPWTASTWLYDRTIYTLWQAGGPALVTSLHVALVLASFLLLLPITRKWASGKAMALALLVCAWLLAPCFQTKPLFVGLFFSALYIAVLDKETKPWVPWVLLMPAQLLWTNMHSSFLLGPGICALFAMQIHSGARSADMEDNKRLLKHALSLTAGTMLITVLNPYGLALHKTVLLAWLSPASNYVEQWISPFAAQFMPSMIKHTITLALVIGAGGLITQRKKLPIALTTLAVIMAFLCIRDARYVSMMAILAFPFIALSLSAMGEALSPLLKNTLKLSGELIERVMAVVIILLMLWSIGSVTTNRYYEREGSASSFGLGVEEELFPQSALSILEKNYFPKRILHLAHDGSYLTWKLPQRKVFIDLRSQVYGQKMYQMLINGVLRGAPDSLSQLMDTWNPGAVMINACTPNAGTATRNLLMDGRWSLAYFDGITAIFLDPSSPYADLLTNLDTQSAGLKILDEKYQTYLTQLGGLIKPSVPPRLIGAATLFLAMNRYEEAEALYSALTQGAPHMTTAWLSLGICQVQLGAHEKAISTLENASRHLSKNALCWLWLSRAYAQKEMTEKATNAYLRGSELNSAMAKAFGNPLSATK